MAKIFAFLCNILTFLTVFAQERTLYEQVFNFQNSLYSFRDDVIGVRRLQVIFFLLFLQFEMTPLQISLRLSVMLVI